VLGRRRRPLLRANREATAGPQLEIEEDRARVGEKRAPRMTQEEPPWPENGSFKLSQGRAASERRVALKPCVSLWAIPRHLLADTVSCKQLPTVTTRATCLSKSRKELPSGQRFST